LISRKPRTGGNPPAADSASWRKPAASNKQLAFLLFWNGGTVFFVPFSAIKHFENKSGTKKTVPPFH
jgi:hypothetical protein